MKRILLKLAYDGTKYSGYQKQQDPSVVTVEGCVNEALYKLTGEVIEVIGASRTDAGVHARSNIAVFDTESRIPPEKFTPALNRLLPPAIRVVESRRAADDFHPRKCRTAKTYEYRIYNAEVMDPLQRYFAYHYTYDLDVEAMDRAGQYLVGEHDFASFCSIYTQAKSTVREVISVSVRAAGEARPREIVITVKGYGFLYNMVRIIVGTLLEVGRGKRTPESIRDALVKVDRRAAGPTAPACGLVLANFEILDGSDIYRESEQTEETAQSAEIYSDCENTAVPVVDTAEKTGL